MCLDYNEIAAGKGVEALDELLYAGMHRRRAVSGGLYRER